MNISVPTNINDITLEQYQKFSKVNTGKGQDEEFFIHKIIEIFCGVDLLTVSKFPLKDATEISNEILDLISQETPFQDRFTMDGIEYGFIPDLQAMTLGEYIDLEDSLKDVQSFHLSAAVMFRPVVKSFGELYTIEPYTADRKAQEAMKNAPTGIISTAIVFFYSIVKELLLVSQVYSKNQLETMKTTAERDNSVKSMDGLTASMHYAEVIRQNIDILQS